jgi:uncharacterized damage-inducible protein DinB
MLDLTTPDLPPALAAPFSLMEHAFRRLTRLVQGMSQAEVEYLGPEGNRNSTAMLVAHVAIMDLGYLHRMQGGEVPPDLYAKFGPYATEEDHLPPVTGQTADGLLDRCNQVLDIVRAYLQTLPGEGAGRPVTIPWWPQPATVRYILWHLAGHSMYHQGQIVRLQDWYKQGIGR